MLIIEKVDGFAVGMPTHNNMTNVVNNTGKLKHCRFCRHVIGADFCTERKLF